MRSKVRVEAEVSTREDSVDMEADSTRITTMAITISGSPSSMVGMMLSYFGAPPAAYSIVSPYSLPKPPRK